MTEMVSLQVNLVAKTALVLQELAAGVGMTPEQWLANQARAAVLGRMSEATLTRLYMKGCTDAEIAREMGLTNQQVAVRRRRLKLPANRRIRKDAA